MKHNMQKPALLAGMTALTFALSALQDTPQAADAAFPAVPTPAESAASAPQDVSFATMAAPHMAPGSTLVFDFPMAP